MARPRKIKTDESLPHKERFLVAFRKWGMRSKALEEADLSLKTLKRWILEDVVFAQSMDEIIEENEILLKDELEAVLQKRAMTSDGLLKFLLGKLDPSYRERSEVEHKGKVDFVFKENLDTKEL